MAKEYITGNINIKFLSLGGKFISGHLYNVENFTSVITNTAPIRLDKNSKVLVFDNRNDINIILHKTSGIDTIWDSVDHIVLDLTLVTDNTIATQLSTEVAGQTNTVDFTVDGKLKFSLGDQDIPIGNYVLELSSVDSSGNKTQLIHKDREQVVFKIV